MGSGGYSSYSSTPSTRYIKIDNKALDYLFKGQLVKYSPANIYEMLDNNLTPVNNNPQKK